MLLGRNREGWAALLGPLLQRCSLHRFVGHYRPPPAARALHTYRDTIDEFRNSPNMHENFDPDKRGFLQTCRIFLSPLDTDIFYSYGLGLSGGNRIGADSQHCQHDNCMRVGKSESEHQDKERIQTYGSLPVTESRRAEVCRPSQ